MNLRSSAARWLVAFLAVAAAASGQTNALPPETVKALEARRAEIDRMQKLANDPAATKSTLAMMPGKLRIEAGTITESRTSAGSGTLSIPLVIFTDEIPANAYILRHEITSAVDDQGRPFVPSANPGAATNLQARGDQPRLNRMLPFQAPTRHADAIKLIEGNLVIFVPAEETGSLARFPGLAGRAGKALEHAALVKNEMEITCLTKEMYDTLKPQWEKSAASVAQPPNFNNTAVFQIKDRNNRLVGVELRDPAGKIIPGGSQTLSTNVLGTSMVLFRPAGPLPPDAEVRFLIADPAALRISPFRLENLPLP